MSDTIGRITVPTPTASGLTFPLVSEFGYGLSQDWTIIEHRFAALAELSVQRFGLGSGARRFHFVKSVLSIADRKVLSDFYASVQGSFQSFTYNSPNPDRTTTTAYTVIFDTQPLSLQDLANRCQTGLTFVEEINSASAPTYTVASTCTRFPSGTLATALLSQTQELIPLIKIRVADPAVPDIFLSDRRCTVGGQLYLPRVLDIGEPGSDILISQDIRGSADNVQLKFGNADRAISALLGDTSFKYASIELSFYHIQSQIVLQLWAGTIQSWQIDGSPEVTFFCSDDLYPLTRAYPPRTVGRLCDKDFDDGVRCPYTAQGSGGDPNECDFSYNGANGCLAHGMSKYFGGHPTFPQSVVIKDHSNDHRLGQFFTSTSIVSDSVWGQPLAEIWCNDDSDPKKAFYANCLVPAVRDEVDFMDVLGIVGAGPLGAYEGMSVQTNADGYKFIVAPLADGFPPHGFKVDSQLIVTGYQPTMGLREVLGTDPVTPGTSLTAGNDAFSLGQGTPQHWDVRDATYSNIPYTSPSVANRIFPYAAGTAFVELRYAKEANKGGVIPSTAESHSMTVPIARGLAGYTFNAAGVRSSKTAGMTNPFWIAVNSLFRAYGIEDASAGTQLAKFVLSSVFDGAGSGCAEISDLSVPAIIGGGSETQFRFQGTLAEQKPFRDWLIEILNCALGYFSFEFGKLRLGTRNDASVATTFTLGNILYQSVAIRPAESAFEKLRIDFANRDLQYQQDYAEYHDKDHSRHFQNVNAPLTSRMRSIGLASLSQALRVCITRVREEIGGILRPDYIANPYIEWDNNNIVTWKSTVLALDCYVGQVVSLTHPDLPTYPGPVGGSPLAANTWKFRIQRMTIHKDWSITFTGRSVTDSMYDMTVGPKPDDVVPSPLPVLFFNEPLGQWHPYQVQANASDALYPSEYTFDLAQTYTALDDFSYLTRAVATGKLPVNTFIPSCGAPDVKKGGVTQATTGGSITGNKTYYVQVCAKNAAGQYSPPSEVLVLQVPSGTNTNTFTLTGVIWPRVNNLTGYVVFVSDEDDLICGQQTGSLTGSASAGYTPTSITVTGPFARSTYGVPNVALVKQRIKVRRLIHGGVIGCAVDSLNSTSITSSDAIDGAGTDNWTGRVLAIIGRSTGNGKAPFAHFNITAFNAATGQFTLDRNPVSAGVQIGDVFVVCFLGVSNSGNQYVVTDTGLSNAQTSHTGETVNDPNRIGNSVFVIKGTSRGLSAKIVSNTATAYTLDQPIPIDSTSVWIVVTAAWEYFNEVQLNNADPLAASDLSVEISNYSGLPVLVGCTLIDSNGGESSEDSMPVRMLWVEGHPSAAIDLGPLTLTYADAQGTQGVPFSSSFVAVGGFPPYTFAITSGSLPTGLSLNTSTGRVSGTPTVAGAFTVQVTVTDDVLSTANLTVTINITDPGGAAIPVAIVSVTGADVGYSSDVVYDADKVIHHTINVTVDFASTPTQYGLVYLSRDGGSNWQAIGYYLFDSDPKTVSFVTYRLALATACKVAVQPGRPPYDGGVIIPNGSMPGSAVQSASFIVLGLNTPANNLVTALNLTSPGGGSFPYMRGPDDDNGYQDWAIPQIDFSATLAAASKDAAFATLTAQDYDASNNPIGVEHKYGTIAIGFTGGTKIWGDLAGPYGDKASPVRSGNIAKVGLRLYLSNRASDSDSAWQFGSVSTLQTSIGTSGLLLVTVASGGAVPSGAANIRPGSSLDVSTAQGNVQADPTTNGLEVNSGGTSYGHLYPGYLGIQTASYLHELDNSSFRLFNGNFAIGSAGDIDRVNNKATVNWGVPILTAQYRSTGRTSKYDQAVTDPGGGAPSGNYLVLVALTVTYLGGGATGSTTVDVWVTRNGQGFSALNLNLTVGNYAKQGVAFCQTDGSTDGLGDVGINIVGTNGAAWSNATFDVDITVIKLRD